MENHTAYICAGSNLGNKLLNCQKGIDALTESGVSILKDRSPFYKTDPVDYQDQDWFVNVVVKIQTALDPFQLLDQLLAIEQKLGRTRTPVKFGPRILDMDIIFYDDRVTNTSRLVIPHPRMHKRRFVLQPICDIDPTIVHPVIKKNVKYLLDHLGQDGQRIVEYPCDY